MSSRHILLIALLAALGCGPSPSAGKAGEKQQVVSHAAESVEDLYPLAVGNAWTYLVSTSTQSLQTGTLMDSKNYERTFKVEKVSDTAEGKIADIRVYDEQQADIGGFQLLVNEKGIYQYSTGKDRFIKFEQPIPWVLAGSKEGDKTEMTTRGPAPGTDEIVTIDTTIADCGQLQAEAVSQRFQTQCVDSSQLYKTANGAQVASTQRASFSPKVGLVRLLDAFQNGQVQQTTIFRLKTYTLK
jgi:hypothetical protein